MKVELNKTYRVTRSAEVRAAENDASGIIEGYAVVFEQITEIREGVQEKISRTAFQNCDLSDVLLLTNHDTNRIPLSRHRRGGRSTMEIGIDEKGVYYRAALDLENPAAKEVYSAVKRGDLSGASFMFWIRGLEIENLTDGAVLRTVTDVSKVWEFSLVSFPAYGGTSAEARSIGGALDNEESALDNAVLSALDNEKKRNAEARQALEIQRKKLLLLSEV